jgi:hypothetical protein
VLDCPRRFEGNGDRAEIAIGLEKPVKIPHRRQSLGISFPVSAIVVHPVSKSFYAWQCTVNNASRTGTTVVSHRLEVFGVRIPPSQADDESGPERFEPFKSFGSSE